MPTLPQANNTMGLAALRRGTTAVGRDPLPRGHPRSSRTLPRRTNNLGNLLAGRRPTREAAYHFEKASRSDPGYVEAAPQLRSGACADGSYTQSCGRAGSGGRAGAATGQARIDLADVLATMGRRDEARRNLRLAAKSGDAAEREAALAGLRTVWSAAVSRDTSVLDISVPHTIDYRIVQPGIDAEVRRSHQEGAC